MIIDTFSGSRSAFRVQLSREGRYRVCRLDELGSVGEALSFRDRDVALAYASASAALDRYLNALDHTSDASAEFDAWLERDEVFEHLMLAAKDAPQDACEVTLH